jgi:hypothetical protein
VSKEKAAKKKDGQGCWNFSEALRLKQARTRIPQLKILIDNPIPECEDENTFGSQRSAFSQSKKNLWLTAESFLIEEVVRIF